MSKISPAPRQRRRRSDAQRSSSAVLQAAVQVFSQHPEASIEDIAAAAGVTRQTVYAHYPSREALLAAAIDHVTAQAVAAMDAADLDSAPPVTALLRFIDAGWQTFARYPLLLATAAADPQADHHRHQPVRARLEHLVRRGQAAGAFDRQLSPDWLATTVIGLGHTAGQEIAAGRLRTEEATAALRTSILRVFGAVRADHADQRHDPADPT